VLSWESLATVAIVKTGDQKVIKIKELQMTNFGPAAGERTISFPDSGTICITGPNGIGKSHVNAAIKFLLCGSTDKQLYSFVHGYGKAGTNKAEVVGTFDHNGEEMLVKRSISLSEKLSEDEIDDRLMAGEILKAKATASIKLGDAKAVRSASEVSKILDDLTGITSSTQEDAIFVDQNKAGAILRGTPAAVQKDLQELSGASVCEKAVNASQAALARIVVVDNKEDIADKKLVIERLGVEIEDLANDAEANKEYLESVDISSIRNKIFVHEKEKDKADKYEELSASIAEAKSNLSTAQSAVTSHALQLDVLLDELKGKEEEFEQAKIRVANADSQKKLLRPLLSLTLHSCSLQKRRLKLCAMSWLKLRSSWKPLARLVYAPRAVQFQRKRRRSLLSISRLLQTTLLVYRSL